MLVAAIERHRRQMVRLLDGLDDLERAAVSTEASGPAEECIDVAALVSHVAGRLRLDDLRLRRLAAELDGRTPRSSCNANERRHPDAHALRPLP